MHERDSWSRRLACSAVAAVLVVGVAACGSDDDGGDKADTQASAADAAAAYEAAGGTKGPWHPTGDGTPEETEVEAAYATVMNSIATGDPEQACAGMTAETRKRFRPKPGLTCVQLMSQVDQAEFKRQPGRISGAEVNGNKAIVLWDNRADKPPNRVPFVRVNGEWKLDGAAF